MTDSRTATLGVLLAGGLAHRMGGGDKPLQTVGGRPILERVIERLGPQCDGLILSANGDPTRFSAFGLPVVPDTVEGFAGPLAGILSALEWAATNRPEIEWLVSIATDCPFLPRDLVTRLQQTRIAAGAELAVAASGGQAHHVIGLWNVAMRGAMRQALITEDIRKVSRWTQRYKIATVEWPSIPLDPFFNANTIDDINQAEQLAALDRS
jgi:molybdopterin-guanine dinucleotide biosynthesis protein A